MFVYDGSSLPGTKTDGRPLAGDPNTHCTAPEFNTVLSASYDLRNSIVSASWFGYVNDSTASLPPAGTGRTRVSGSVFQVAVAGTGFAYRDVPLLDSGSLNVVGSLTASAISLGNTSNSKINGGTASTLTLNNAVGAKLEFGVAGYYLLIDSTGNNLVGPVTASQDISVARHANVTGNLRVQGSTTASLDLTVTRHANITGNLDVQGGITGSNQGALFNGLVRVSTIGGTSFYIAQGDTLGLSGNGTHGLRFDGTRFIIATTAPVTPSSDAATNLGSTAVRWSNFYVYDIDVVGGVTGSVLRSERPFVQPSSTTAAGAATVNKPLGRSAIAAGQSAVRILNNMVTTGSFIQVTPENWDPTLVTWAVSASAGYIDVSGSAAATRDWGFNWKVLGST